jgi:hypothetical protein
MVRLDFIGTDYWGRHVFKDENGKLWKDVNCGSGAPDFYSASGNEFDGEPDMPLRHNYELVFAGEVSE